MYRGEDLTTLKERFQIVYLPDNSQRYETTPSNPYQLEFEELKYEQMFLKMQKEKEAKRKQKEFDNYLDTLLRIEDEIHNEKKLEEIIMKHLDEVIYEQEILCERNNKTFFSNENNKIQEDSFTNEDDLLKNTQESLKSFSI